MKYELNQSYNGGGVVYLLKSEASQSTLQYDLTTAILIRTLTQPHTCERGSSSFAAMSRLKFVSTTSASFPSMPSTEGKKGKNASVVRDSAYRVYLYFSSPIETGAFPLVPSCRCLHSSLQIWRRLWRQFGFLISLRWGLHLWYPICALPYVPPTMIWCGPGGWGVHQVRS